MTRIARSIEVLTAEVHARSPKTTIYHYDDTPQLDSDHDPNASGVVCAADIMQGNGLDLAALSEEIRARRHPAGKYVIYSRRIASATRDWVWRPYYGSNPHTDHIHVSVGVGPDGHSTGDYDNTEPWLLEGDDMFCKYGDKGEAVKLLQLRLLRLDPKALGGTTADGGYGDKTATAVKALLGGSDGRFYGAILHDRMEDKLAALRGGVPGPQGPAGPAGPQGPAGAAGRDGVVPSGATFVMQSPPVQG